MYLPLSTNLSLFIHLDASFTPRNCGQARSVNNLINAVRINRGSSVAEGKGEDLSAARTWRTRLSKKIVGERRGGEGKSEAKENQRGSAARLSAALGEVERSGAKVGDEEGV